jgi:hypothetical protein
MEWELVETGLNLSERVSVWRKRIGQMNNRYVASHKWPTGPLEHERAG